MRSYIYLFKFCNFVLYREIILNEYLFLTKLVVFQSSVKTFYYSWFYVSILLYGCTTWTSTKRLEKKLDGNYTRIRPILNKSWWQHLRHARRCWGSRDELISDVLLWSPTYGRAKAGRPGRTYIQQLCEDTGCNPEDLSEAMNDREKWRKRVKDIRASSMT